MLRPRRAGCAAGGRDPRIPITPIADGAPSVLFNAVALVVTKAGAEALLSDKAALAGLPVSIQSSVRLALTAVG